MTRSAAPLGVSTAPRARRSSSSRRESAWLTRQPKVMIEYFTVTADGCSRRLSLRAEARGRGLHLLRKLLLVLDELGRHRAVADGDDLRREHRSEEHTSELQSQFHLVCRLLLEKKKKTNKRTNGNTH